MARILGVHVALDEPTVYASAWASMLMREARGAGHEARELTGSMVTPYGLLSSMEQYIPDLVILAGHGNSTTFFGAGLQKVLQACQNDGMMKGSQCVFISCLSGLVLVPSIVSKGGIVATGFTRNYSFMIDGTGNPATDVYAASFTRIWVESCGVIFRGGSWQDFFAAWKRLSDEEIARWGQSSDPLAPSVILSLRMNRNSLVVNGAGTLEAPEPGVAGLPILPLLAVAAALKFG